MESKFCGGCLADLPVSGFGRNARQTDGFNTRCRECYRRYHSANKQKHNAACKERYVQNRQQVLEAQKKYRTDHAEAVAARSVARKRQRRQEDPVFRMVSNIRRRIRLGLKGEIKSSSTEGLLGCTFEDARRYIETRFSPGMSWSNYGAWHVDHIVPVSAFDMSDPAQQREAFVYTNLQPMWASDNLSKSAKRC